MKNLLFAAAWLVSAVLLSWGTWLTFFHAPVEAQMGFVQKIFYFHVPVAWIFFLAVAANAGSSIGYLITKKDGADRAARGAAELAVIFGLMVLITGPLWGWKAWGRPWVWDVRLTSSLLLWLVLVAYLVVRAYGGHSARNLAAGLSIFAVLQVPLIYWSVDLWRGTHPPRLVSEGGLNSDMATALWTCVFAFIFLFAVLYALRLAIGRQEGRLDELHLHLEDLEEIHG
ncbi:MAG: cytochrome c biogenesis protein CcsA [Deltaproteobacteria bacterium]|nr:cytochrome c biogenesis protein CcsA [Deltaproteobacteria bacterium]